MAFSINLHTIKSGWSIVYIEGSQVIISKNILHFFFFLQTVHNEISHNLDPLWGDFIKKLGKCKIVTLYFITPSIPMDPKPNTVSLKRPCIDIHQVRCLV